MCIYSIFGDYNVDWTLWTGLSNEEITLQWFLTMTGVSYDTIGGNCTGYIRQWLLISGRSQGLIDILSSFGILKYRGSCGGRNQQIQIEVASLKKQQLGDLLRPAYSSALLDVQTVCNVVGSGKTVLNSTLDDACPKSAGSGVCCFSGLYVINAFSIPKPHALDQL